MYFFSKVTQTFVTNRQYLFKQLSGKTYEKKKFYFTYFFLHLKSISSATKKKAVETLF